MKMRLGQEAAQAVRDAEACVNIGRAYTQVDCGLAYAEHILKKTPEKTDLDDVSTGIYTAANSAEGLKRLLPPEMHDAVESFANSAKRLNKDVREKWVAPPKDEKTKKPKAKEPFTELDHARLASRTRSLRRKANEIFASARGLCRFQPATPAPQQPTQTAK